MLTPKRGKAPKRKQEINPVTLIKATLLVGVVLGSYLGPKSEEAPLIFHPVAQLYPNLNAERARGWYLGYKVPVTDYWQPQPSARETREVLRWTPLPQDVVAASPVCPLQAGWCQPPHVGGRFHVDFRPERHAPNGRLVPAHRHQGVDIPAPVGTPVYAAMGGRVHHIINDRDGSAGLAVELCHDDTCTKRTRYLHLDSLAAGIVRGAIVRAGQTIAHTGDTGTSNSAAHLHFELWDGNREVDPTGLFVGGH